MAALAFRREFQMNGGRKQTYGKTAILP